MLLSYEQFKAFPRSAEVLELLLSRLNPDDLVLFYDDYREIIEQPSTLRAMAERCNLKPKKSFKSLLRLYDRTYLTVRSYNYKNRCKGDIFLQAARTNNFMVAAYGWSKYSQDISTQEKTRAFSEVIAHGDDEMFKFFMERDFHFYSSGLEGAAEMGKLDRLKLLLNHPNLDGVTVPGLVGGRGSRLSELFGEALRTNRPEIVYWLLEQGVEVTSYHLRCAALSGNLALLDLVLGSGVAPFRLEDRNAALGDAAYSGNLEVFNRLLPLYPEGLASEREADKLLYKCVDRSYAMTEFILEQRRTPKCVNDYLMRGALQRRDFRLVELFLKHGGQITGLCLTATSIYNVPEVVLWLLEHHSSAFKEEDYSDAMINFAKQGQRSLMVLMLDRIEPTSPKLLKYYNMAMIAACEGHHNSIVWEMIEKAADDFEELTITAACGGNLEVFQWLAARGLSLETYHECIDSDSIYHVDIMRELMVRAAELTGAPLDLWSHIESLLPELTKRIPKKLFQMMVMVGRGVSMSTLESMMNYCACDTSDYENIEYLLNLGAPIKPHYFNFHASRDILKLFIEKGLEQGLKPAYIFEQIRASMLAIIIIRENNEYDTWNIINHLLHLTPDRASAEAVIRKIYKYWSDRRIIMSSLRREYPKTTAIVESSLVV